MATVNPQIPHRQIQPIPDCCDCGVALKDPRSVRCKSCAMKLVHGHRAIDPLDFDIDTDECIPWPFALRNGYGIKSVGGTTMNAHRWVWLNVVGPIPEGLHLDHLCRNKACVNVRHLDPVTASENKRRSWVTKDRPKLCPQGHDDWVIIPSNGWRRCRTCQRLADKRSRAKKARLDPT